MAHGKLFLIVLLTTAAFFGLSGCGVLDGESGDGGGGGQGGEDGGPSGGGADGGGTSADGSTSGSGETGRMVGMTEAHNTFRRAAETSTPIPDLVWNEDVARFAQSWAEKLASEGCDLVHSTGDFGENLFWQSGKEATAEEVVKAWHDEIECYTFGPFMEGDNCDEVCIAAQNSSGCGHYTQVVWRDTRRLGCGMAICDNGAEIWSCNYDPPGNYVGEEPF